MAKHFLTFGGGSQNFRDASMRLKIQVEASSLFDYVHCYIDADLEKEVEFWNTHKDFISKHKRGHGYWIWKSYLILKTLESMKDNDILLYLDAGCELNCKNIKKLNKMKEFFSIVQTTDIIYTIVLNKPNLEKFWNKMDLIKYLDVGDDRYLNTPQIQGGILMLRKCDKVVKLIRQWYELSCNYHFLDDSKSIEPDIKEREQYRHDQSILSLLIKKHNMENNYSLYDAVECIHNRTGDMRYPP